MKKRFFMFFLMIAIVAVMVLGIIVFLSLWDSSGDPGKTRAIGFPGANTVFAANTVALNPYQVANTDRDTAVMIGASVSYILKEVKYFTLCIIVLTVLALNAYALIVYFVLEKIAKPGTTLVNPEIRQKTVNNAVMGHFNGPDGCIKRTSSMLSLEIDEMLAEIDSVMERCKADQGVLLK